MNGELFAFFAVLSPYAITALGSFAVLISWIYFKDGRNYKNSVYIALMTLMAAYAFLLSWTPAYGKLPGFILNVSPSISILLGLILFLSIFSVISSKDRIKEPLPGGEYYFLIMTGVLGAMLLLSAKDLLTAFLSLELMSMSFYALTGFGFDKKNAEAALKYFMLGSFASVFMAMGLILSYGYAGSLDYSQISQTLTAKGPDSMSATAFTLVFLGFIFKIALVPLHFWTPDVYEGAPSQISALMASLVKTAGTAAIFFFFSATAYSGFISVLIFFACITMLFANIAALRQTSVKRMLAYSSISHAGYLILGFSSAGGAEVIFYLIVYSIATFGAFSFVYFFEKENSNPQISDFEGFFKKAPLPAAAMSVFLFSLAGIPPLSGFFGKFYLFAAALKAGFFWPVIIALISSAVSLYYYLSLIVAMFMKAPKDEGKIENIFQDRMLLSIFAVLTLLLGIFSDKILFLLSN